MHHFAVSCPAEPGLAAEDVCGETVEIVVEYRSILAVDVAHQINVRRLLRALGARVPGWRSLFLRFSWRCLRDRGSLDMRMFWMSVSEVPRFASADDYPIVKLWKRAPDLAAELLASWRWIPSTRYVAVSQKPFEIIEKLLDRAAARPSD